MREASQAEKREVTGEVVDFDQALLDSCSPEVRADLLSEASLLAQAFAPDGRREQLEAMAETLSNGARDADMDRAHARRLAAAMRRLAQEQPED